MGGSQSAEVAPKRPFGILFEMAPKTRAAAKGRVVVLGRGAASADAKDKASAPKGAGTRSSSRLPPTKLPPGQQDIRSALAAAKEKKKQEER